MEVLPLPCEARRIDVSGGGIRRLPALHVGGLGSKELLQPLDERSLSRLVQRSPCNPILLTADRDRLRPPCLDGPYSSYVCLPPPPSAKRARRTMTSTR